MKYPALLHIAVETSTAQAAVVGAVLEQVFQSPHVSHLDLETGRLKLSVYVAAATTQRARKRAELVAALNKHYAHIGQPVPRFSFRTLKPNDWSESWKRHFKPIEISGRLLVKPSWSRRKSKSGVPVVVLDPGLSFGTGQHPTTRFCLGQIVAARVTGTRQGLLDIGTGSGILAIAAAKLGYDPVAALDFDRAAVRIARENILRNRVERIDLTVRDVRTLRQAPRQLFDVVCANLTHDLLIQHGAKIAGQMKPNGWLVLAGILESQFAAVSAACAARRLRCTSRLTEGEWTSGVFRFDVAGERR